MGSVVWWCSSTTRAIVRWSWGMAIIRQRWSPDHDVGRASSWQNTTNTTYPDRRGRMLGISSLSYHVGWRILGCSVPGTHRSSLQRRTTMGGKWRSWRYRRWDLYLLGTFIQHTFYSRISHRYNCQIIHSLSRLSSFPTSSHERNQYSRLRKRWTNNLNSKLPWKSYNHS